MRRKVKTFPRENVLDRVGDDCYHAGRKSLDFGPQRRSTPEMSPSASHINPRKVWIPVINPHLGGWTAISLYSARRHVARGIARMIGGKLEFIRSEREIITAEIRRLRSAMAYDRVQRPMTLEEIAAIPVVCPERLMIDRSRGRSKRARN